MVILESVTPCGDHCRHATICLGDSAILSANGVETGAGDEMAAALFKRTLSSNYRLSLRLFS